MTSVVHGSFRNINPPAVGTGGVCFLHGIFNDRCKGCDRNVEIARAFHETYERLAPFYGYTTREESAVAWDDVPDKNRALMTGVVQELLRTGVIK